MIQNIRKFLVHLVGVTEHCDVPATTISLRHNQLEFGQNEVLVSGNILFYNGRPSFKASLFQALQYGRGILDTLAQQAAQQASITTEFCDPTFLFRITNIFASAEATRRLSPRPPSPLSLAKNMPSTAWRVRNKNPRPSRPKAAEARGSILPKDSSFSR